MTTWPSRPLTVATVQARSVSGDVAANAAAAAAYVRQADARLVALPEMFLPGYDVDRLRADVGCDLDAVDPGADARIAPLLDACADTGSVALVGASARHRDGRRTISLLMVDSAGARIGYDKQHLWSGESDVFSPGTDGATLEVDGWPVGLAICYDGCFPEHARAACEDGALVYVAAVAYLVGSEHRRDLYYRARAVENGCYVVVSGLVGPCGDQRFNGGSAVHDPEGRTLASCDPGAEGIAVARLDPSAVRETRAAHTMHADHRADLGGRHHLTPAGQPAL